jgi:hypothetical protein
MLRSVTPTQERRRENGPLGRLGSLSGTCLGQAILRREHGEQLERSHCQSGTTGMEDETDRRWHKHLP